jgi:hypothetical protein
VAGVTRRGTRHLASAGTRCRRGDVGVHLGGPEHHPMDRAPRSTRRHRTRCQPAVQAGRDGASRATPVARCLASPGSQRAPRRPSSEGRRTGRVDAVRKPAGRCIRVQSRLRLDLEPPSWRRGVASDGDDRTTPSSRAGLLRQLRQRAGIRVERVEQGRQDGRTTSVRIPEGCSSWTTAARYDLEGEAALAVEPDQVRSERSWRGVERVSTTGGQRPR